MCNAFQTELLYWLFSAGCVCLMSLQDKDIVPETVCVEHYLLSVCTILCSKCQEWIVMYIDIRQGGKKIFE